VVKKCSLNFFNSFFSTTAPVGLEGLFIKTAFVLEDILFFKSFKVNLKGRLSVINTGFPWASFTCST